MPILAYPNATDIFILDTDASGTAMGAVLSQLQDGDEKVISYESYVLTPEQHKYCITRRELLAVVRFTRQFCHYLLGCKFYLRTDHNSLTWLLRFKYIAGQLARWLEELSQFDMTVQHRPGNKHGNVDGLSRIPDKTGFCNCYQTGVDLAYLPCQGCKFCTRAHQQWSRFESDVDDVIPLAVRTVSVSPDEPDVRWILSCTEEELSQLQRNDPCLKKLIVWLQTDLTPSQRELSLCSPMVKYFYLNRSHLSYQNNLLWYSWKDVIGEKQLLVVPECLKQEILTLNHDIPSTGHMGIAMMLLHIRKSFIWYKMSRDVELFVKCCQVHQKKKANTKAKAGLGQYHVGSPLERVHVDILGPFIPSTKGNQYILMIVNQFTKWLECFPLPHQNAEETTRSMVDGFISRLVWPIEIHMDQGKNFDGKLFATVCDLLQITKTRTTLYRPCFNGQVEFYNRTLVLLIRCFLKSNQKSWDEHIQQLTRAIR